MSRGPYMSLLGGGAGSTLQSMIIMEDFLLGLVPKNNPLKWLVINLILLCYSVFMLGIFFEAEDEDGIYIRFAKYSYLAYNFTTTSVWCFETALGAWYELHYISDSSLKWTDWINIAAAIFFLQDSGRNFYDNNIKDIDVDVSDVVLLASVVFFAYMVVILYLEKKSQEDCLEDETNLVSILEGPTDTETTPLHSS